jgi:rare lipoprotein A
MEQEQVWLWVWIPILLMTFLLPSVPFDYGMSPEDGLASWYGQPFHGRRTASGEVFDMFSNTAAHRWLPFNTLLRITNTLNGRIAIVRVNDRGPYISGRDIDVSYAVASQLDFDVSGLCPVYIEIIRKEIL